MSTSVVAPRARFRDDVQGLRALAVIAVVLYHADGLLPGGFVGVDVFFVISGFVILRSLLSEHERTDRIDLGSFYRRRIRRLTPMLALVVAVTVPLAVLAGPLIAADDTIATGAAAMLLHANHQLLGDAGYFGHAAELNALLHTWSLSLEEQFYLVFPLVAAGLLALGRRRGRHRVVLGGLVLLSGASLLLCLRQSWGIDLLGEGPEEALRYAFFSMPTRAWQFGVGAGLAVLLRDDDGRLARRGHATLGLVLLLGTFVLVSDEVAYPGLWSVLPTLATALLLVNPHARVLSGLRHPTAVRLGDASYSWYLLHWPAIVIARALGLHAPLGLAVVGLATGGLALVTYRHVEQRFTTPTRSGGQRRALPAAVVGAALGLGLLLGPAVGPMLNDADPDLAAAAASNTNHLDVECDSQTDVPGADTCRFGEGDGHLMLVGDSNAGHITEAVVGAGEALDARVTTVTRSTCPFFGVVLVDGIERGFCTQAGDAIAGFVETEAPDVVVLALASDQYVSEDEWQLVHDDATDEAAAFAAGMTGLVEALEMAGTEVLLVHQLPKFDLAGTFENGARGCATLLIALAPDRCGLVEARAEMLERRQPGFDVEAVVLERTGVAALDLFDAVCPDDPCRERQDGRWLYRDPRHISVRTAQGLAPLMADAVRPLLSR